MAVTGIMNVWIKSVSFRTGEVRLGRSGTSLALLSNRHIVFATSLKYLSDKGWGSFLLSARASVGAIGDRISTYFAICNNVAH